MNSMTGFGRAAAQTDRYNILVEISGVNRKQTEIAVNVPRGYAEWDASVRSIVQGAVSRGRVGVSISVERLEEADGSLLLDEQKLASLAELLNRRPPAAWLAASHDGSSGGQAGCSMRGSSRCHGRPLEPGPARLTVVLSLAAPVNRLPAALTPVPGGKAASPHLAPSPQRPSAAGAAGASPCPGA
mgnify:CR=1 FL=1